MALNIGILLNTIKLNKTKKTQKTQPVGLDKVLGQTNRESPTKSVFVFFL
jgi:hypothetical protein